MSRIKILGSCSGTEPMPGRMHTSIAFEINGDNYFFDAGEGAAWGAHLGGINLLNNRAMFISHAHSDHIMGLPNVLCMMRKLVWVHKEELKYDKFKLFTPNMAVWESIRSLLKNMASGIDADSFVSASKMPLGLVYEDENIKVTAFESHHLKRVDDEIVAFSFRIEALGKVIVFSGDVKSMDDLRETVGDGCDLLMCETGHHAVKDVCDFAEAAGAKQLLFVHHGREILYGEPTVKQAIDNCRIPVSLSEDGTEIEL